MCVIKKGVIMRNITDQALSEIKAMDYERPLDTDYVDPRLTGLFGNFDVNGLKILEIGTLDGYHSCELAKKGAKVTATDIRPANLTRALFRSIYMGLDHMISFRYMDMENMHTMIDVDEFDMIFHSGCFYHLNDPIEHLHNISKLSKYMMLETHIANPIKYEPGELKGFKGTWYPEGQWGDTRASKDPRNSFWLEVPELKRLINECGMTIEHVIYESFFNPHGNRECYLLKRK